MNPPVSRRSGWTIDTWAVYHAALRSADLRFQEERDRRYSEVNTEREKALKIKEEADKAALGLAREIQTYKDEKANQLREQINNERGDYATKSDLLALSEKFDASHKPVVEFMAASMGRGAGTDSLRAMIGWIAALVVSLIAIGSFVFRAPAATPIYVPAPYGSLLPSTPPAPAPR
jgi:hypothetical protein